MNAMFESLEVNDQDGLRKEDDSSNAMSSQFMASDDWSEYDEGLDQEDSWIESYDDMRSALAEDNSPIKQLRMETDIKDAALYQNTIILDGETGSDIGHDQEDPENGDQECEETPPTVEVEGELVVRLPLTAIAIEEQNFDVADIKLVKLTEIDEMDIDW